MSSRGPPTTFKCRINTSLAECVLLSMVAIVHMPLGHVTTCCPLLQRRLLSSLLMNKLARCRQHLHKVGSSLRGHQIKFTSNYSTDVYLPMHPRVHGLCSELACRARSMTRQLLLFRSLERSLFTSFLRLETGCNGRWLLVVGWFASCYVTPIAWCRLEMSMRRVDHENLLYVRELACLSTLITPRNYGPIDHHPHSSHPSARRIGLTDHQPSYQAQENKQQHQYRLWLVI